GGADCGRTRCLAACRAGPARVPPAPAGADRRAGSPPDTLIYHHPNRALTSSGSFMADQLESHSILPEVRGLELRIGELRQVVAMPAPDLRMALDAAMAELDLALSTLQSLAGSSSGGAASAEAERRVLRTVFHDAPVGLFLVDRNSTVRRVNRQA